MTITEQLERAKNDILKEFPYYGPLLVGMRFQEVGENVTRTAAIGNRRIMFFNRDYMDMCIENGYQHAVVFHEALHYLRDHGARFERNLHKCDLPHEFHNVAMDMEVNSEIEILERVNSGRYFHFKMPNNCVSVCLPDQEYPERLSYEEYVELLIEKNGSVIEEFRKMMENIESMGGIVLRKDQSGAVSSGSDDDSPDGSGTGDDIVDRDGTLENQDITPTMSAFIKQSLMEGLVREYNKHLASKGIGNFGLWERDPVLRNVPPIYYNWKQILRRLVRCEQSKLVSGGVLADYTRMNRRMCSHGGKIIFPANVHRKLKGSVGVIVDISGSMDGLTEKMYSLLRTIRRAGSGLDIDVLETDCSVQRYFHNFNLDQKTMEIGCGGGTDMEGAYDFMVKNDLEYSMIIIMTDNEVPWNGTFNENGYKNKVHVITNKRNADCPYIQHLVSFAS